MIDDDCDKEYNIEECGFDGGDCILVNKYPNCEDIRYSSQRKYGGKRRRVIYYHCILMFQSVFTLHDD